MKPKSKKVCFVCGSSHSYVFVAWEDPYEASEFKCDECSVDWCNLKHSDKKVWLVNLIDAIVRKKKARLVLQEALNG